MAIIPKQIGWSNESNLIWELLRKVDQLVKVTSTGGGGTPTLQQVLDNNHDLTNGRNYQGTGAGVGNSGDSVNAFGLNAAVNNSQNDVNAFGPGAGSGNSYTHVNLFGNSATANDNNQLVLGNDYNTRIGYAVNADRLFEFPKDVDGTFKVTNYYAPDLTSADYYAVNPGVYFLNNGNTGKLILPDCTLMVGQTITLWNRSSGGNIDLTGNLCSITNPDNSVVALIPTGTTYTFVATPVTWLKTN